MATLITRDQWQAYYGVPGASGGTPTFNLMGEGFTSLSESKNPSEYSRRYIHEKTERSDVTGFAPSMSYSCDVYSGDPVVDDLLALTDGEVIGSDAQRDIVAVNLWEQGGASGSYVAYKRTYSIVPDAKGDGTDALIISGTMKAAGESVKGTFNTSTKTFTADSE